MKKVILGAITIGSMYFSITNAGTMGPIATEYRWNGFYIGANAGYWWSDKFISSVGSPSFINPLFPLGAGDIANALAVIGTNNSVSSSDGFIGGAQVGYNYQPWDKLMLGLDADIDGLTNHKNSSNVNRVISLVNFPETYTATGTLTRNIDYLGTVRGKLGYLFNPSMLIYGIGGFAYGGISFNGSLIASESLGPISYPTVYSTKIPRKTHGGWTAGAGLEWMFRPQWSAKIEYSYFDLGTFNSITTLGQINNLGVTPVLWGAANVFSSSKFSLQTVRLGVNYHFA